MGGDYDEGYAAQQIARQENLVRRTVRSVYLRALLKLTEGPVCDLGCGIGSFLRYAPEKSVGLDINRHAVDYCCAKGLKAYVYDAVEDDFRLTPVSGHEVGTLLLNHFLEHFLEPMPKLQRLLASCVRLGIGKVVVVTPGVLGFRSDKTHKTYIDADFYKTGLVDSGFLVQSASYFPLPFHWGGDIFLYNELRTVLSSPADATKTQYLPNT